MRLTLRSAPVLATLAACVLCVTTSLRAQVSEVPQTIAPGHILMRMDAISIGVNPDTSAPNQYKALALGTTLVSAGLTSTVDFEAGAQLFLRDTFTTNGSSHTQSGIGDVSLRSKWMFYNDPSSGQEAALIPFVLVPTNASVAGTRDVQGGVILPWSVDVAAGFKLGAMAEWDEMRNVADTRYDTRWFGSAYAQWNLGDRFGMYGEATLSTSTAGSGTDTGSLGAGATLNLNGNFQWDFEVSKNLGVGRSAWTETLRFRWKIL